MISEQKLMHFLMNLKFECEELNKLEQIEIQRNDIAELKMLDKIFSEIESRRLMA